MMRSKAVWIALSLSTLALAGCGDGPRAWILTSAEGLPEGLRLRAAMRLEGEPLPLVEEIAGGRGTFLLGAPADGRGALAVRLEGLGEDLCVRAQGEGTVQLDGSGWHNLQVPMSPVTPPQCEGGPSSVVEVAVQQDADGTITSEPPGIDCGARCSAAFPAGTQVKLTAVASGRSHFAGWGGACGGTEATCTVTADQLRRVTAAFTPCMMEGRYCALPLPAGFRPDWLWGVSAKEVYAGYGSVVYRWDGKEWQEEKNPMAYAGRYSTNRYSMSSSALQRWDGSRWVELYKWPSTNRYNYLSQHTLSDSEAWVYGYYEDTSTWPSKKYSLLERCGTGVGPCSPATSTLDHSSERIRTVWGYGTAAGQAWLMTYAESSDVTPRNRLYRRTGDLTWARVPLAENQSPDFCMSGGPGNLWCGTGLRSTNGDQWTSVDNAPSGSCPFGDRPTNMWSSGGNQLHHFDGSRWTRIETFRSSATFHKLNGMDDPWALSEGRVFVRRNK